MFPRKMHVLWESLTIRKVHSKKDWDGQIWGYNASKIYPSIKEHRLTHAWYSTYFVIFKNRKCPQEYYKTIRLHIHIHTYIIHIHTYIYVYTHVTHIYPYLINSLI